MTVDTDKMAEILKREKPLTVFDVEEHGKTKLTVMFVLPELSERVRLFAESILEEHQP